MSDHEWCSDMGPRGAFCVHTFTTDERQLDKATWDALRVGQFCTTDPDGKKGSTIADIKATLEKLCSVTDVPCVFPDKK